ncbi:hypothetical protein BsWGS_25828 [Bradybaena similaris]
MTTRRFCQCHLLLLILTCLGRSSADYTQSPAKYSCKYQDRSYENLEKFDHENGCTQMQCQFGEAVPISEACGKEIDNSCHEVQFTFVLNEQEYRCTKSIESGTTVYKYVTQQKPVSPKGCSVGKYSYRHLDLAKSLDTCRVRQCQNGLSPFVVAACFGRDKLCHPVNSIYVYNNIMYKCDFSTNVFRFLEVQEPTTEITTTPTTVPTTESTTTTTTVPTTESTTTTTTVPTTESTTTTTTVPTTESTTTTTTVPTTESTTTTTTVPTTESTTTTTSVPTTESTTTTTRVPTTESTTTTTRVPTIKQVRTKVATTESTTTATTAPARQSTTVPPIARSCVAVAKLNVMFVVDGSGSIARDNFQKILDLLRYIVQAVSSSRGLKFALLTFASRTRVVCPLTDDKQQFLQSLDKATYQGSTSHTFHAIDRARGLALSDDSGARTVLVVPTDGKSSNSTHTCQTATRAKEDGDIIFTIGAGEECEESELQCLASGPGDVFRDHAYSDLIVLAESVAEGICNVSPRPAGLK